MIYEVDQEFRKDLKHLVRMAEDSNMKPFHTLTALIVGLKNLLWVLDRQDTAREAKHIQEI